MRRLLTPRILINGYDGCEILGFEVHTTGNWKIWETLLKIIVNIKYTHIHSNTPIKSSRAVYLKKNNFTKNNEESFQQFTSRLSQSQDTV